MDEKSCVDCGSFEHPEKLKFIPGTCRTCGIEHENWWPRPSEIEKQEEFHALTAHRYDKRREIR